MRSVRKGGEEKARRRRRRTYSISFHESPFSRTVASDSGSGTPNSWKERQASNRVRCVGTLKRRARVRELVGERGGEAGKEERDKRERETCIADLEVVRGFLHSAKRYVTDMPGTCDSRDNSKRLPPVLSK